MIVTRDYCPGDDEEVIEDLEAHEDEEMGGDDSVIPTHEVVQHVVTKKTAKNCKVKAAKGNSAVGLGSSGEAEDADAEIALADDVPDEPTGKRKRRANAHAEARVPTGNLVGHAPMALQSGMRERGGERTKSEQWTA
ncbi:hypothetical protein B0H13DRAFT_2265774 [Mycena leptocephala]|nr:hypothetical protein B0H13DRAFT_2265774 [Mycena leptocephala]